MEKKYSVYIPISMYLKKFTEKRYGNPIPINNHNTLGILLIGIMGRENFGSNMFEWEKDIRYRSFTEQLHLSAHISLLPRYNYSLTKDQVIQINRFLEKEFEQCLYLFVRASINLSKRNCGYKEAIYSFADLYDIELDKDITYDCLKKIEYRYRKKLQEKFVKVLSPRLAPPKMVTQQLLFV